MARHAPKPKWSTCQGPGAGDPLALCDLDMARMAQRFQAADVIPAAGPVPCPEPRLHMIDLKPHILASQKQTATAPDHHLTVRHVAEMPVVEPAAFHTPMTVAFQCRPPRKPPVMVVVVDAFAILAAPPGPPASEGRAAGRAPSGDGVERQQVTTWQQGRPQLHALILLRSSAVGWLAAQVRTRQNDEWVMALPWRNSWERFDAASRLLP